MSIEEVKCDGSKLHSNSTLLIASDHPIFVAGVRAILNGSAFEVVGEVSSIHALVEFVTKESPDVVLLDMEVDVVLDHVVSIRQVASVCKVLLMSPTFALDTTWAQELEVHGLLSKASSEKQLLSTLQQLVGKEPGVPIALPLQFGGSGNQDLFIRQDLALRQSAANRSTSETTDSPFLVNFRRLRPRELTVLRHISRGFKVRQIAALMKVKEATVLEYIQSIYYRTGVNSRGALVRWLFFAEASAHRSSRRFSVVEGTRKP